MDNDASLIGNLDSLVLSVAATITFSLRTTKQLGGAGKVNSPEGSDFFLGYITGFSDALVQAAGGQSRGEAFMALAERSLVRLFGAGGARNLFASIKGAVTREFHASDAFENGVAAGGKDARAIITDKERTSVGKSFIAWYVPDASDRG